MADGCPSLSLIVPEFLPVKGEFFCYCSVFTLQYNLFTLQLRKVFCETIRVKALNMWQPLVFTKREKNIITHISRYITIKDNTSTYAAGWCWRLSVWKCFQSHSKNYGAPLNISQLQAGKSLGQHCICQEVVLPKPLQELKNQRKLKESLFSASRGLLASFVLGFSQSSWVSWGQKEAEVKWDLWRDAKTESTAH